MFCNAELKELVNNKRVQTINGLPRKLVKEFYDINPDEAYQLICWAELTTAKSRAEKNPADTNAQDDYEQRLFYFKEERQHTGTHVRTLSAFHETIRENKRREIFARHEKELKAAGLETLLDDCKALAPYNLAMSRASAKKSAVLTPRLVP
jgi:hypothetical protein